MNRFAVIADVHGNRWALEAVLADIARRGIRHTVNAGDNLAGPLDQEGTAGLLISLNLPSVAGNQDRELADGAYGKWLASLPGQLHVADDILMFHGTPERNDAYLLESVRTSGEVSLATDTEILERLGGATEKLPASLMICGHTHIPRTVDLRGLLIVNPGSVGLQAYSDDSPVAHVMETGSPKARYAIIGKAGSEWHVEHVSLDYHFEAAALTAERNGRPDWAWRLRTGRAFR